MPKGILKSVVSRLGHLWSLHIRRDPYLMNVRRWKKDRGDETLRLNYPLSSNSVVFDVGGFKGNWTAEICARYDPLVYVFEPVPHFSCAVEERFRGNPKVTVYRHGLFNETRKERISILDDQSSIFMGQGEPREILLVDVYEFMKQNSISSIDLMKVNIEGAEYALLTRMIETEIVEKVRDIQVQFHTFYPDADLLRDRIRESLERTHRLTYDYPFVWENWKRKR